MIAVLRGQQPEMTSRSGGWLLAVTATHV